MPKVSIIIPTYNSKTSFLRALNSVLQQNYQDYEIVITDDSTNSEIENIVKALSMEKIKYYKNAVKLGAPENWNEGIRHASGEYIKILHHDDWLSKVDGLEKFVKMLDENPKSDFGYSKSVDVNCDTGKQKHRHAEKYVQSIKTDFKELINHNRIGAPSVIIFRNGLNIFFDKNLKWLVDIDFYIRLILKNNNIAFINEELINIGLQENRLTDSCINEEDLEEKEKKYVKNKIKQILNKQI